MVKNCPAISLHKLFVLLLIVMHYNSLNIMIGRGEKEKKILRDRGKSKDKTPARHW